MNAPATPGVYRLEAGEGPRLVHAYVDDDYGLDDIEELFALGIRDGDALVFDVRSLRALKAMADAESFDHAENFIRMCVELADLEVSPDSDRVRLVSLG